MLVARNASNPQSHDLVIGFVCSSCKPTFSNGATAEASAEEADAGGSGIQAATPALQSTKGTPSHGYAARTCIATPRCKR